MIIRLNIDKKIVTQDLSLLTNNLFGVGSRVSSVYLFLHI